MLATMDPKSPTNYNIKSNIHSYKSHGSHSTPRLFDKSIKFQYGTNEFQNNAKQILNNGTGSNTHSRDFNTPKYNRNEGEDGFSNAQSRLFQQKPKSLTINMSSPNAVRAVPSYATPTQSYGQKNQFKYGGTENGNNASANSPEKEENPFDIFMKRLGLLQTKNALPNYEPAKSAEKTYGIVKSFGVVTNQGLVRNYNEDRVSIVLNIVKPAGRDDKYWPNINMFGVFDGHGGQGCADFLRTNLHQYIIKSKHFPWEPSEAIKEAFEEADNKFLEQCSTKGERSGSCAVLMILIDESCFIANLGDSRAILSQNAGSTKIPLTRDHKPSDPNESKRITNAGGRIYQNTPSGGKQFEDSSKSNSMKLQTPHRIFPGKLSVSRAFGDAEAKFVSYGGNPDVLIAKPEITNMKIAKDYDFVVIGSDGIYDRLTNEEIINIVWELVYENKTLSIHDIMKQGAERILKECMLKKAFDNLTVIIVAFQNFVTKVSQIQQSNGNEARPSRPQSKNDPSHPRLRPGSQQKSSDQLLTTGPRPVKPMAPIENPDYGISPSLSGNQAIIGSGSQSVKGSMHERKFFYGDNKATPGGQYYMPKGVNVSSNGAKHSTESSEYSLKSPNYRSNSYYTAATGSKTLTPQASNGNYRIQRSGTNFGDQGGNTSLGINTSQRQYSSNNLSASIQDSPGMGKYKKIDNSFGFGKSEKDLSGDGLKMGNYKNKSQGNSSLPRLGNTTPRN